MRMARRGRGRPPRNMRLKEERRVLEYVARIAVKHTINPSAFFNCIVDSWSKEEARCEELAIRCRKKTEDSAVFLFTRGGRVLAQFPIPTSILQGNNQLERLMKMIFSESSSARNLEVTNPKITDLKAGMKKVNLKARVLEIPEPKTVYTRFGTLACVSSALVGDETGTIRMSLWNQQISVVSKGDKISIENGKVANFRGERQLRIGKSGSLTVIE
jgi:replication factor A1